MTEQMPSSTAQAVTTFVSGSAPGTASMLAGIPKQDLAALARKVKARKGKKKKEKKQVPSEPHAIDNGFIVKAASREKVWHKDGGKTYEFIVENGYVMAVVESGEFRYYTRAGTGIRLTPAQVHIHGGRLKSKDDNAVVTADTAGPSLDQSNIYYYKGELIKWTRGQLVYQFRYDGGLLQADPVSGDGEEDYTEKAQSRSKESLGFGDLFIKNGKAVTEDDEEIFPQGKVDIRLAGQGVKTSNPKEQKKPAAEVEIDTTSGALTYKSRPLSVNGCDLHFLATDGCVMAEGGYEVVDSGGAQIDRWQDLEIVSDQRMPRAKGKYLDLQGWDFGFGVVIGIPDKYRDDAVDAVVRHIGLDWQTEGGQQVAIRKLGKVDGHESHLSVVQSHLRTAVIHGMGVGFTRKQVLESLEYHVTVEITGFSDHVDNARYFSKNATGSKWSKRRDTNSEYDKVVDVAAGLMCHY